MPNLKSAFLQKLKYYTFAQKIFLLFSLSTEFPSNLNIEPTNHCNLKCSFCPTNLMKRKRGMMQLSLFKKIVDQIRNEKKLKLVWLNKDGEPLLHKEIDKFIKYLADANVTNWLEMYSNGLQLNEVVSRKILESGLDNLIISIDANDTNKYKKLKGCDSYNELLENIYQFQKIAKKKTTLLSVKLASDNEKEIEKFKKFWQGKVSNVLIQPLHSWEGTIEISDPRYKIQDRKRYACNLPWFSPAITWDGKVMPCCVNFENNELVMGDIRKDNLKKIWQGKSFKNLREAHLKKDFTNFPTCKRCSFWQQLPNMEWRLKQLS